MQKMNCWSCGKEINDNSKFCPECGASMNRKDSKIDSVNKEQELQPKQKQGNKKKGLIIGLSIIALIAIALAGYFLFGSNAGSKKSVMPYGVQWGDSPEILLKKDKNAVKGGINDKGEQTYRNETIDGTFFNLSKDVTEKAFILYRFMDNKLCGILVSCPPNTSVISPDDFMDGIIKYYYEKFNMEPDLETISYVWPSEQCTVKVTYFTDDLFFIEYSP